MMVRVRGSSAWRWKKTRGYSLSQRGYLQDLLREYAITDHALLPVPKEWCSVDQDEEQVEESDIKAAQSCVGALVWLSQRTRPDLSYAVALMGSWATKRPVLVGKMARRVMAYLNSTQDHRLYYDFSDQGYMEIVTYTDASFAPQSEKSVGAAVVLVQGCAVAWRTGKQKMIATSSAEAELQAATEGAQMMISIAALLKDMEVVVDGQRLLVDNLAAICLASHESSSWRTRHLKLRANWLREQVDQGMIEIQHCPGDKMLADVITKPVASRRMSEIMDMWGCARQQCWRRLFKGWLWQLQARTATTPTRGSFWRTRSSSCGLMDRSCPAVHRRASAVAPAVRRRASAVAPADLGRATAVVQSGAARQNTTTTKHIHGRAPASHRDTTHAAATGLVSKARGPLLGLCAAPEQKTCKGWRTSGAGLSIDPAFDLYLAVLIVGVCAVIMWEMLKGCGRTATRAVRLRALATPRSRPLARQGAGETSSAARKAAVNIDRGGV